MIKNEMNVELIKIELADVDECDGHPGGSVFIKVNNKTCEVIIHPCGEYDFDGDVLDEDEMDAVFDFIHTNDEVNDAFPGDEFP